LMLQNSGRIMKVMRYAQHKNGHVLMQLVIEFR
uniref:Serine/threonine protein kinase n=1 Tax=Brugia timori TaxID=42155 RepID=A0A0R3R7G3_9BILA